VTEGHQHDYPHQCTCIDWTDHRNANVPTPSRSGAGYPHAALRIRGTLPSGNATTGRPDQRHCVICAWPSRRPRIEPMRPPPGDRDPSPVGGRRGGADRREPSSSTQPRTRQCAGPDGGAGVGRDRPVNPGCSPSIRTLIVGESVGPARFRSYNDERAVRQSRRNITESIAGFAVSGGRQHHGAAGAGTNYHGLISAPTPVRWPSASATR